MMTDFNQQNQRAAQSSRIENCEDTTVGGCGRCVSCSGHDNLQSYPIHSFRTSHVASDSMTNGAAAVRQTTYLNTTTYHGLLNTSVQICDRCVWKKRLRIVAVATIFMASALVLLVLAWRLMLFSVPLAWIGGWRLQAWKTAGARLAAKRSKRQLAARGYPYTRIGHIHASYPKVSCDPPHCDGSVGRAETQGIHTVSGFV